MIERSCIQSAQKATGSTAESTPCAELVALHNGIRTDAMPLMALVSKIVKRRVRRMCYEDNETAITAIKKGYSPTMRHLPRAHDISLARLNELLCNKNATGDGRPRECSAGGKKSSMTDVKDGRPREC